MGIQKEWFLMEVQYESLTSAKERWSDYPNPSTYREEYPEQEKPQLQSLAVGTTFQEFQATTLDGEVILLNFNQAESSIFLLDFWHLGCAPCLKAIPELEKFHQKFGANGLKILGLNPLDQENIDKIILFKNKLQVNYPLKLITKEIQEQFQVSIFPTLYLVKGGKVIFSKVGYSQEDFTKLEELIQTQISGQE